MRIGFDRTFAEINQAGTGVYVKSLASALSQNQSVSMRFFSVGQTRDVDKPKTLRTRLDTLYRDFIWMHAALPLQVRRAKVNAVHLPANISPLASPCPVILTILDAILYQNPQDFPFWQRNYFHVFGPGSARRAAHIITLSEASKQDIVRIFDIVPEKVTVIPIAVSDQFRPLSNSSQEIRQRFGLGRYILTVGAIEPRKNLTRLVEAFERVREAVPGVILVHAGPHGWHMDHLTEFIARKGLADQVRFLGKVPLEDLVQLYNAADVVAYPSLYEGFGLPVLEAMACGSPVVSSDRSSIPEVASDAAILVDPYDVQALANALTEILENPDLAHEYRNRGLSRAKEFSWARCAEQTIGIYKKITGE